MTEIRIFDGNRLFHFAGADLDRLKADCPHYQCELIYQGDGVLTARPYQRPETLGPT